MSPRCPAAAALLALALSPLGACTTFGFGRPVEVEHETHLTPSGIELVDLRHGKGAPAIHGTLVRVHYVARLEDGVAFDSSYDRGLPEEFVLGAGRVIVGWEEGMLGMREGGRRRMRIPSELAYGAEGLGDLIPPDSVLELEVELLRVKRP